MPGPPPSCFPNPKSHIPFRQSQWTPTTRIFQNLGLSPQEHTTCIGIAKSTEKQCRCQVAGKSRDRATEILKTVATTSSTTESVKQDMKVVAGLLLCKRFHQDQTAKLSSEWMGKLWSSGFPAQASMPSFAGDHNRAAEDAVREFRERSAPTLETTAIRSRRQRRPNGPLSMNLCSAARADRSSHVQCGICRNEYSLEDDGVVSCTACQNADHKDCAEEWATSLRIEGKPITYPHW